MSIKKFLCVLLCLAILCGCFPIAASAESTRAASGFSLLLDPAEKTLSPSDKTVTLTLRIANNPGLWALRCYVVYPDALTMAGSSGNAGTNGSVFPKSIFGAGRINHPLSDPDQLKSFKDIITSKGLKTEGYNSATFAWVPDDPAFVTTTNGTLLTLSFSLPANAKATDVYNISVYTGNNDVFSVKIGSDGKTPVFTDHVPQTNTAVLSYSCAHSTTNKETLAPTCGADGYEKVICASCGTVISHTILNKTSDHTPGAAVIIPSTCTQAGVSTVSCTVCGEIISTDSLGLADHTPGPEATCSSPQICTVCSSQLAPMSDHVPGKVVESSASCTEDGYVTTYCKYCSQIISSEIILSPGHSYIEDDAVVVAPTCKDPGYTLKTCEVCGEEVRTDETPTTDHTPGEDAKTVSPTYVTDGYTLYTCTVCKTTYKEVIPATGIPSGKAQNIEYYNALKFTTPPTIDGYISVEEWGTDVAPIEVSAMDCATIDDTTPYSRFFYNRIDATNMEGYEDFSYQVWFRWDFDNFYIGVKVKDPDVHSLKYGTADLWNGDSVQIRVDKGGANASTYGEEFVWTETVQKPWSSEKVPDMIFGYVEITGGFSEAWENTTNKGMTSFSNNPLGAAQCVVSPAGSDYSTDTQNGITTYEIALPWSYVFNGELSTLLDRDYRPGRGDAAKGAYGRELGVSLAVLNDGHDQNPGYDAFVSWGSGICGAHQLLGNASATGSNSVILVRDTVDQKSWKKYDPSSLLDAKFSKENIDESGVYYDYLAGDKDKSNPVSYDELKNLSYDNKSDQTYWGAESQLGKIGNFGDSHGNVLDFTNQNEDFVQTYLDSRDGETIYYYPTSYTFEFDILYTSTHELAEGYAPALYNWFGGPGSISYQCGYYFNDKAFKIIDNTDVDGTNPLATYAYDLKSNNWYNWKFQYDNESCTVRLWIDDLTTSADNNVSGTPGTPGYTCEWGTLIFNTSWRYFYYSSETAANEGCQMIFRQMNTNVAYDNVKIYNFATNCDHTHTKSEHLDASCTENGYDRTLCIFCEKIMSETTYPAIGHKYNENGVCANCGETKMAMGDINADGQISAKDLNAIKKYLAGISELDSEQSTVADINGDGFISATDMNLICRLIAGIISEF